MKRRYGVFSGLVLSLFSPAFYRDVAINWGGIGFVYLLLLFVVTWVPVLTKWQMGYQAFVKNDLLDKLKDFPEVSLKGGQVESPVAQPYTIKDPQTDNAVFVLDTTGVIDSLEKTPAQILVTKTQLHVRNEHERRTYDLKDFPDTDFSKEKVQDWAATIGDWLGVACFPFVMVGSMLRALIVILAAGVVGLVFRMAVNPDITYGSLVRLGALGITLPTYIDTGLMLAGRPSLPFWFFITIALTSVYVVFGARAGFTSEPAAAGFDDNVEPPLPPLGGEPGSDAIRAR